MRLVGRAALVLFLFAGMRASPVSAAYAAETGASDPDTSMQEYVTRTREISASDYTFQAREGDDNTLVYLVTLAVGLEGIPARERIFEVIVDLATGKVVGEREVGP